MRETLTDLTTLRIEKPDSINFILGQTHFIKNVEDMHEALATAVPDSHFTDLQVRAVAKGEGWREIESLPRVRG